MPIASTTAGHVFGCVLPVDIAQRARHQAGDEHQRRRGGEGRDRGGQRSEQQRQQEQHRHRDRGQAGAAAGLDAGGALDVAGGRAGAQQRSRRSRRRCRPAAPRAAWRSCRRDASARRAASWRSACRHCRARPPGRTSARLSRRRATARPAMSSCRKVGASDGGGATTPCNCVSPNGRPSAAVTRMPIRIAPGTPRAVSPAISRKPRHASSVAGAPSGPSVTSVAGLPVTTPISCSPINPRNRPMPAPMPSFSDMRDGVDQPLAHAQQADDQEQHAGEEHRAQRHLPGQAHALHHGEGEVGVQPHARRQRQRQIGEQSHRRRTDRGGDAGGNEGRTVVDARARPGSMG